MRPTDPGAPLGCACVTREATDHDGVVRRHGRRSRHRAITPLDPLRDHGLPAPSVHHRRCRDHPRGLGHPHRTAAATGPTLPAGYTVNGIDVSGWQGSAIDWSTVAGNAKFVYAKATEGTTTSTRPSCRSTPGAKAAGLFVGAYAFGRPDSPASPRPTTSSTTPGSPPTARRCRRCSTSNGRTRAVPATSRRTRAGV